VLLTFPIAGYPLGQGPSTLWHPVGSFQTPQLMKPPQLFRTQARWALRKQFGRAATEAILRVADGRYESPPPIARTVGGRQNLRMAAYLLALRDALLEAGVPSRDADGLLADGLFRVMSRLYRPLELASRLLHPRDAAARSRWRERLARHVFFKPPDWVMREVSDGHAYAFSVRRCLLAEYMRGRGEELFCQDVLCSQDLLMAQARGELLLRPSTIAGGAPTCDFRFIRSDLARA
jgi:L-2-amino-thiazoline-4-carboxylic acid hydrolase-like protein